MPLVCSALDAVASVAASSGTDCGGMASSLGVPPVCVCLSCRGAKRSLIRHPLTYLGSREAADAPSGGGVVLGETFSFFVSETSLPSVGERRSMKGRCSSAFRADGIPGPFDAR